MKPIILDYAIERKEKMDSIYEYDFSEALNMLTIEGDKIPFIDSTCTDIALQTKTRATRESDDIGFNILEMQTKTFTQRERDDESFSYN